MKRISKLFIVFVIVAMILSLISCAKSGLNSSAPGSSDGGYYSPSYDGSYGGSKGDGFMNGDIMAPSDDMAGDMAPEEPGGSVEGGESSGEGDVDKPVDQPVILPSGMITAGAWNDNTYYSAWLDLFTQSSDKNGKFYQYTTPYYNWGFNSLNRIKVTVQNGENNVAGANVYASDSQGNQLFAAVTDANGVAYLFTDGSEGNITVKGGDQSVTLPFTADDREIIVPLGTDVNKLDVIEIMLLVDVTGSMGDEISFLKAELADVINRISQNNNNTVIKLAMLFYRDTEDRVPFDYYDFTDVTSSKGLNAQQTALNKQYAEGGGDYPEAVDHALEIAVNKQWSTGATTKIIFHVLDAPAHEGAKYAEKLVNATKIAAEKGIRLCPIICSGAQGSTEYIMREAAIYTGGTFIFVTDDSGIGGSHHDPELPNVTVELLNSLMVRLVNGYHTGNFAPPTYWKEDPNLNNK